MDFSNEYIQYGILILSTSIIVMIVSFIARKALDLLIKRNSEQLKTDATNFIFLKNSLSFIYTQLEYFGFFIRYPISIR
jgi:hypothetical protein